MVVKNFVEFVCENVLFDEFFDRFGDVFCYDWYWFVGMFKVKIFFE